jgi:hypothetical protein
VLGAVLYLGLRPITAERDLLNRPDDGSLSLRTQVVLSHLLAVFKILRAASAK